MKKRVFATGLMLILTCILASLTDVADYYGQQWFGAYEKNLTTPEIVSAAIVELLVISTYIAPVIYISLNWVVLTHFPTNYRLSWRQAFVIAVTLDLWLVLFR